MSSQRFQSRIASNVGLGRRYRFALQNVTLRDDRGKVITVLGVFSAINAENSQNRHEVITNLIYEMRLESAQKKI